jgi:hypothetical protein
MTKKTLFVFLGLMLLICGLSISPLWLNQCSHQYTEEEKTYLMQQRFELIERNWSGTIKGIDPNEFQQKMDQYRHELDKEYVPCGVSDLSPEEKEKAAYWRGRLLSEMSHPPSVFFLPLLRFDLEYARRSYGLVQSHHYVGYTVFYIPVIRAYGGGSGAMGFCPFSSECVIQ